MAVPLGVPGGRGWLLAAGGPVAAGPPGGDQRRVLVGCVLPGEVPGIEDVELAARQPVVQELGVDRRHRRVAGAGDDLHRRLDLRQQVAQGWEFGRVGADVAHRLGHPVTLISSQVVLADGIERYPLPDAVREDYLRAYEGDRMARRRRSA